MMFMEFHGRNDDKHDGFISGFTMFLPYWQLVMVYLSCRTTMDEILW